MELTTKSPYDGKWIVVLFSLQRSLKPGQLLQLWRWSPLMEKGDRISGPFGEHLAGGQFVLMASVFRKIEEKRRKKTMTSIRERERGDEQKWLNEKH